MIKVRFLNLSSVYLITYFSKDTLMSIGVVKWFNPTKGYGFIQPEEGGSDVFVHMSALERAGITALNEGQRISYELATNKGRTSAVNLKLVK